MSSGMVLSFSSGSSAALLIGAVIIVVWALAFGTGRRSAVDPDATDADLEREKTMQYYVRSTRIPPP